MAPSRPAARSARSSASAAVAAVSAVPPSARHARAASPGRPIGERGSARNRALRHAAERREERVRRSLAREPSEEDHRAPREEAARDSASVVQLFAVWAPSSTDGNPRSERLRARRQQGRLERRGRPREVEREPRPRGRERPLRARASRCPPGGRRRRARSRRRRKARRSIPRTARPATRPRRGVSGCARPRCRLPTWLHGRPDRARAREDRSSPGSPLAHSDEDGSPGLDDARLLGGDLFVRRSEHARVLEVDARDDADARDR